MEKNISPFFLGSISFDVDTISRVEKDRSPVSFIEKKNRKYTKKLTEVENENVVLRQNSSENIEAPLHNRRIWFFYFQRGGLKFSRRFALILPLKIINDAFRNLLID